MCMCDVRVHREKESCMLFPSIKHTEWIVGIQHVRVFGTYTYIFVCVNVMWCVLMLFSTRQKFVVSSHHCKIVIDRERREGEREQAVCIFAQN